MELELASDFAEPFTSIRDAALMLLALNRRINRSSAGFLGHCAVTDAPLTPSQRNWLDQLLEQNELPPLIN